MVEFFKNLFKFVKQVLGPTVSFVLFDRCKLKSTFANFWWAFEITTFNGHYPNHGLIGLLIDLLQLSFSL